MRPNLAERERKRERRREEAARTTGISWAIFATPNCVPPAMPAVCVPVEGGQEINLAVSKHTHRHSHTHTHTHIHTYTFYTHTHTHTHTTQNIQTHNHKNTRHIP